jgi:DUF2917 family protein
MRIDGVAAMIALEREASLRVEPGSRVEIACLSGVVWVTHEGDTRDLFLARGESLVPPTRGVTMVTALEPATVRVLDCAEQRSATRWWAGVARIVRGAAPWLRLVTRTASIVRLRGAVAG